METPTRINYGLIHEPPRPTDHIHGLEAILGGTVWAKRRNVVTVNGVETISWADVEPEYELQRKANVEMNACVSFSGDNVIEYLLNDLGKTESSLWSTLQSLGLIKNGKVNVSDRRTAKGSGTDPAEGNTVRAVDDYLRAFYVCPEDLWPFPDGLTKDQYYTVMPAAVADYGKKCAPYFTLATKYVPDVGVYSSPAQMWDALQYSPCWVSVDGNYQTDTNDVIRGETLKAAVDSNKEQGTYWYNHRVTVRAGVFGQYWEIHDHYLKQIRKFAWDYPFAGVKIMNIEKKTLPRFLRRPDGSIAFYGLAGKYGGKYLGAGNGDTMLAVWGSYMKEQRADVTAFPSNYTNQDLFINE